MGVKKCKETDQNKMALEHLIRALNPLAVGGDCRMTVDREIKYSDAKTTVLAGLQYTSYHEYLGGDTKGALERLNFQLSDVMTPKLTPQACRQADRRASMKFLVEMLWAHIEFWFPEVLCGGVVVAWRVSCRWAGGWGVGVF